MQNQLNNNTYKKRKITTFLFLFICACIALIAFKYFNIGIPCPIKTLTGFDCPGCGITRCILSIFELNFYQAFRYNMLVFCLIVLYVLYLIARLVKYIFKKDSKIIIPDYVYIILIVITIVFGILRNIDAFSFLAPTVV